MTSNDIIATLYLPNAEPINVSINGIYLPDDTIASVHSCNKAIAVILGCSPQLVDILDNGPDFAAYSIFDYEGEPNISAIHALSSLSRHSYSAIEEELMLYGPILILTKSNNTAI